MNYRKQKEKHNFEKLNTLQQELPPYTEDFFRGLRTTTTSTTQLSYAYDLRLFFRFLSSVIHKPIRQISLNDLENISEIEVEKYIDYLTCYTDTNGKTHHNSDCGKSRKLMSLRRFYDYFYKRKQIQYNPTLLLENPKNRTHNIIRMEADETEQFLNFLEFGNEKLEGMQKVYFYKNQSRNMAICTLLLGTGIRVSECVGLDLNDVNFTLGRIRLIRKGEKEDFVYFEQEVYEELQKYLIDRKKITPLPGHEEAFFLSSQRKRLSVHAVENMISDYTSLLFNDKHITPHKLRSTFGTNLYRLTGDIFLVAECLGHEDVNTTKKYYTALDEDRKKYASNIVQLRQRKK